MWTIALSTAHSNCTGICDTHWNTYSDSFPSFFVDLVQLLPPFQAELDCWPLARTPGPLHPSISLAILWIPLCQAELIWSYGSVCVFPCSLLPIIEKNDPSIRPSIFLICQKIANAIAHLFLVWNPQRICFILQPQLFVMEFTVCWWPVWPLQLYLLFAPNVVEIS